MQILNVPTFVMSICTVGSTKMSWLINEVLINLNCVGTPQASLILTITNNALFRL